MTRQRRWTWSAIPQVFFRSVGKPVVFDEITSFGTRPAALGEDAFQAPLATARRRSPPARSSAAQLDGAEADGSTCFLALWDESHVRRDRRRPPLPRRAAAGAPRRRELLASHRELAWIFFARDIQRLFGFRDRAFNAFFEYVLRQSQFEVTSAARVLASRRPLSRAICLRLDITHAASVIVCSTEVAENAKQPKGQWIRHGHGEVRARWDPLREDASRRPLGASRARLHRRTFLTHQCVIGGTNAQRALDIGGMLWM